MKIKGKNIDLRTASIDDAGFIFQMRQRSSKTKYLSQIKGSVSTQKRWLQAYKKREEAHKEYYFIIESKRSEPLGLIRMYDFRRDSFCWGSWLIKDDAPHSTAIESALQIYEFAFYTLDFMQSHFEVQKGNDKVIAFHKRFGAKVVYEDEDEYHFIFTKESYEQTRVRYQRYL